MKIRNSNATYSKITAIGEKIKSLEKSSGREYLYLNQGVNNVCNIDINNIAKQINFNAKSIQVYPAMRGKAELLNAINKSYFSNNSSAENITVTGGGMSGLDLTFQNIDVDKIVLPSFYWGSYANIMKIRNIDNDIYETYEEINARLEELKNSAVIICDPNNPIGDKFDDNKLLQLIRTLNNNGTTVIIDSPYRRVFFNDDDKFYSEIFNLENVIIIESFSKSIGLSGQRIGFVHSINNDFNKELAIRLMYATNGINAFSQMLVAQILNSEEGKIAANNFKSTTINAIKKNIDYLIEKKLIANNFFKEGKPMGIFTIVNISEENLLKNRIGSVSLSFFTKTQKEEVKNYSRICVSIPHEKFIEFFRVF